MTNTLKICELILNFFRISFSNFFWLYHVLLWKKRSIQNQMLRRWGKILRLKNLSIFHQCKMFIVQCFMFSKTSKFLLSIIFKSWSSFKIQFRQIFQQIRFQITKSLIVHIQFWINILFQTLHVKNRWQQHSNLANRRCEKNSSFVNYLNEKDFWFAKIYCFKIFVW